MPVLSLAKRPYVRLATLCPKSPSMRQQRARLPLHRTEQGDCQKTPGHIRPCIPQGLSGARASPVASGPLAQGRGLAAAHPQGIRGPASGPALALCVLYPPYPGPRQSPPRHAAPGRRPVSCKAGSRNFSGRKRSDIPGNLSQVTKL